MDRIYSLLILFGLVLLVVAGYDFVTGGADAGIKAVLGIGFIGSGVYLAGRPRSDRPIAEVVEKLTPNPQRPPKQPRPTIISVIQTGDDDVVDRVERLLENDERISSVVSETGRWHSTPDRDDLPEWTALRVYCGDAQSDKMIEYISERIRVSLGTDALNKVTIQPY